MAKPKWPEPPYDYSPIISRKPIRWPGDARIAVWVIPNIEYFRYDLPSPAALNPISANWRPDIVNYSWRDYGVRVGVWRMMEVLDKYGVRATVALNSEVCRAYPIVVEEGMKRGWEFMGHGVTNSVRLYGLAKKQEQATIREALTTIKEFTGETPRGWLGPGLGQTYRTLSLLSEAGIGYVGDWVNDDQPYPFSVGDGSLLSMPYSLEINDILIFIYQYQNSDGFFRQVCDQFDVLYEEGASNGRIMGIALHPYIIGAPSRIKSLDRALQHITQHQGVWLATGKEIEQWYREHYMNQSS